MKSENTESERYYFHHLEKQVEQIHHHERGLAIEIYFIRLIDGM